MEPNRRFADSVLSHVITSFGRLCLDSGLDDVEILHCDALSNQLFAALLQCPEGVKLLTPAVFDPLCTSGQLDGLCLRESGDLRLDNFVG